MTQQELALARRAVERLKAEGRITIVTEPLPYLHTDEQLEAMRLRCQSRRQRFKAMGLPECGHQPARNNCCRCSAFERKKHRNKNTQ